MFVYRCRIESYSQQKFIWNEVKIFYNAYVPNVFVQSEFISIEKNQSWRQFLFFAFVFVFAMQNGFIYERNPPLINNPLFCQVSINTRKKSQWKVNFCRAKEEMNVHKIYCRTMESKWIRVIFKPFRRSVTQMHTKFICLFSSVYYKRFRFNEFTSTS